MGRPKQAGPRDSHYSRHGGPGIGKKERGRKIKTEREGGREGGREEGNNGGREGSRDGLTRPS